MKKSPPVQAGSLAYMSIDYNVCCMTALRIAYIVGAYAILSVPSTWMIELPPPGRMSCSIRVRCIQ